MAQQPGQHDPAFDHTVRVASTLTGSTRDDLRATKAMFLDGAQLVHNTTALGELAPFAPGYLLAKRYRIRKRIGHGGFGFVYAAEDVELEVIVAIKVLRPEIDGNQEMLRRFKQEIQLARKVTHQNVCRIFDVGFYELADLRVPFLSMELLQGESLAERLRRDGPLSIEQVKLITIQVANALEAAHRAGIVHADLKPANIMLVGQGMATRAVVTDFGLASAHSTDEVQSRGGIVGTPAYMAPEQVQGRALTPATDFYALGCTIYELLSGELPFEEDTALATANARLNRAPPSLKTVASATPTLWVSLVRDLMALDPKERLAQAPALRSRLRGSRTTWIVGSLLLVILMLAGALYFTRAPSYGEFTLSLPAEGPARDRYEQGLVQWESFHTKEALEIWQKAIDDGFDHPRIHYQLCSAINQHAVARTEGCREEAFKSSRSLPRDERDYYEALYRSQNNESVEATKLSLRLLRHYPGNLEISLILVDIQKQQQEFDKALETISNIRPGDAAATVTMKASLVTVLTLQKSYAEAIAEGTKALPMARELGLVRQEISILEGLGQSYRNLGDLTKGEAYGEQSLQLARSVESPIDEANAISLLVAVAIGQEHYARADELVEVRTAQLRAIGNIVAADRMLITKAEILLVAGKPRESERLLTDQALPLLRKAASAYWQGYALIARSDARRTLGEVSEALEDCYAGEAIFGGLRSERLQAFATMVCGNSLIDAGRFSEAEDHFREARNQRTELKLDVLLIENTLAEAELFLARAEARAAYDGARDAAERYAQLHSAGKERSARELMARAALANGELELAEGALQAARALEGSENVEMELRLRLLALRIGLQRDDSDAARDAIEALAREADEIGYLRTAKEARDSLLP